MKINIIFIILWALAVILFTVIILLIIFPYIDTSTYIILTLDEKEKAIKHLTTLLVPLGVLISAALASTSVMKSINNTNKIEREKDYKNMKNADKYFRLILLQAKSTLEELQHIKPIVNKFDKYDITSIRKKEELDEEMIKIIIIESKKALNTPVLIHLQNNIDSLDRVLLQLNDRELVYTLIDNYDILYRLTRTVNKIIEQLKDLLDRHSILVKNSNQDIKYHFFYVQKIIELDDILEQSMVTINLHIHGDESKIKF